MRRLKAVLLWMGLIAATAAATGCNTMEGVGEDVSALGRGIQRTFDGDDEQVEENRATEECGQ